MVSKAQSTILAKVSGSSLATRRSIWLYSSGKWLCCSFDLLLIDYECSGDVFPLHPLDVVSSVSSDPSDSCIGTFIPQTITIGGGQL